MKIVIIGGERVPYFLAKRLIAQGYDVYFVNRDKELCEEYSKTLNATIVNGDATSKKVLDQLEIEPSDIVVLLMERDRKNFFVARLVQEYYGVKNVVTLLNNSENLDLFERFGIRTLGVTDLIMRNLEPLLFGSQLTQELEEKTALKGVSVIEVSLSWDSNIARKKLKELNIPEDVVIVGIKREDGFIIPRGETTLQPGDEVILVCPEEKRMEVLSFFSS
ncbi:trk system potassium uptake protein TrkA [Fervidobacterium changbaicum]|uniref:TrkA family potassium uptake protein n=1 Tax=Fervidobacterium changbaicum TaxID=310769 RepID=A0ABX5QSS8_9BACT|nr:TrkA family potassium uptake protein [Fervidobacterium changbaicum]QAV33547.1 TrkA family potassium uptake protein [Fervidobacterium changbaicum]SDH86912.1 trk system potassium uptake protein TrkA [Fervidobacterium changbaicum]